MTAKLAPRHASCEWCAAPIPVDRRASARFCSVSHRVMGHRKRRRAATAIESVNRGILAGVRRVAA